MTINLTAAEFRAEMEEMKKHYRELDYPTLAILEELQNVVKPFKPFIKPYEHNNYKIWIQHEEEWYFANLSFDQEGTSLFMNYDLIILEPKDKKPEEMKNEPYDATAFLLTLKEDLTRSVGKAEKGEYESWVEENLPLNMRQGVIHLGDVSEESAKLMRGEGTGLSDEEIETFLSKKDRKYKLLVDQIPYHDMNARVYYHMHACIAKECRFEGVDTMTDKEIFFKYFAGRWDYYLDGIDEENAAAFTYWYDCNRWGSRGGFYAYCGNRSLPAALMLCQDEEGYFIKTYTRLPEGNAQVVRFYNALVREDYPTYIEDPEELLSWLEGDYYIAVVPESIIKVTDAIEKENYWHALVKYEDLPNEELRQAVQWFPETVS